MLQSSPTSSLSNKDETRSTAETLSQLRVKICSVRFPSSSKLVDIFVIMEVDCKYTYRTEVIRRKNKNNSTSNSPTSSSNNTNNNLNNNNNVINVSESFDALVTSNSKIKLRIVTPTRLFNNHDIGQLQFNLKKILDDYSSSDQIKSNESPPSYSIELPLDKSNGIVDLIFYGSLIEQRHQQYRQTDSNPSDVTETIEATTTNEITATTGATASSADRSPNSMESRIAQLQQKVKENDSIVVIVVILFSYHLVVKFDSIVKVVRTMLIIFVVEQLGN